MKLLKPEYPIEAVDFDWVFLLSDKEKKKAFTIWRKRWLKLFDAFCQAKTVRLHARIARLEIECYERCCAIKWPEMFVDSYRNKNAEGKQFVMRYDTSRFQPATAFLERIKRWQEDAASPYETPSIEPECFRIKGRKAHEIPKSFYAIHGE